MTLLAMVLRACGDGLSILVHYGGASPPPPHPGPLRPQGRRGREGGAVYVPPPPYRAAGPDDAAAPRAEWRGAKRTE